MTRRADHGDPRGSLDQAFDEVQIGLTILTLGEVIQRINPAGARLLGREPQDLAGVPLTDILHDDDLEAVAEELIRLRDEGSAGPILVRIAHPSEGWRSIRAHATLLADTEPTGFIVFEDVTDELAVASALRVAEERNARRYAQQLGVVDLGRLALSGTSPIAVAQRAADIVSDQLGAVQATALFDDGHDEGLLQVAASGAYSEMTGTYRRARDSQLTEVFRTGQPLFIDDLLAGEVYLSADERAQTELSGLRSVVLTPILPAKARPGVLVASSEEPGAFDTEDAGFLESLSHVIAASLDSDRAVGELRHRALHDPLTELANRTLVMEHLELALRRARRHGGQVAVAMCDLDRFKAINDTHGHAVGDIVLRTIGRRIASHLRQGDLVGRFGGDELVVVLTELKDGAMVRAIGERLVEQVRQPIDAGGREVHATVSAGLAVSGPDESGSDLLRRADRAMYEAKSSGRDRFVLATGRAGEEPTSVW